jgi:hypothetical protein
MGGGLPYPVGPFVPPRGAGTATWLADSGNKGPITLPIALNRR